ncbi:MAG: M1 family metallopeptidase, partial [Pyrinomonadaceae bacterium]
MKPTRTFRSLFAAALLVFLVAFSAADAYSQRRERLIDTWRPVHYEVSLTFNQELSEVARAEARVTVLALKETLGVIDFDFGEMPVDSVSVGGMPAPFEQKDGRLNVTLAQPPRPNERLLVTVIYHGQPADGLKLTNDKDGRPSATGDNWPDRLHHWVPSLDHPSAKATVTFNVNAPAQYTVVSNGRLAAQRANPDNMRTWTWTEAKPIPPYCMIVAVGQFAVVTPNTTARSRIAPLTYYVPPSERAFARRGFGAAPPALTYLTRTVGPFPYEKLAHIVGATRFGGMENAGAIVYNSALFDPRADEPVYPGFYIRRGLVEVVAHETAHQWFGDSVTPATWSDVWLSEGFATYFAGLFVENYVSDSAFRDFMHRAADKYFQYEQTRRAPIYDPDTEDLSKILNANTYQKGAWVLHMLRRQLGDRVFFQGVRAFYLKHQHATATTEDLRLALERASGKPLRDFFQRWVYESGHPQYQLTWTWEAGAARRAGTLALTLTQAQEAGLFLTPVPIEIVMPGSTPRRHTLRPAGRQTTLRVPLPGRPAEVRIDPQET